MPLTVFYSSYCISPASLSKPALYFSRGTVCKQDRNVTTDSARAGWTAHRLVTARGQSKTAHGRVGRRTGRIQKAGGPESPSAFLFCKRLAFSEDVQSHCIDFLCQRGPVYDAALTATMNPPILSPDITYSALAPTVISVFSSEEAAT